MGTTASDPSVRTAPVDPTQTELILSRIDALPPLPAVAVRLLELTTSETSGAREVIDLISSDQSLSARLLSLARRAHLGTDVRTIDRAVVLLGFDAVRHLVLSIQVFEVFAQRADAPPDGLDRLGCWKHALAVGCAARLLAEHHAGAPRVGREEAFLCGLLHDIGKLVLDVCFPRSYARVIRRVVDEGCDLSEAEREVFGLDHTLAGKRLAAYWKLPAMIAETVWLHHHTPASTPTRIGHPRHVCLVQLADRIVREMRIGFSGTAVIDPPAQVLAEEAGLPSGIVDRVKADVPAMIEARAELIGLDRLTSADVLRDALSEANAELARLNDALRASNHRLNHRAIGFAALNAINTVPHPDAMHEDLCLVTARAFARCVADGGVAVFAASPARSLLFLAVGPMGSRPTEAPARAADAAMVSAVPLATAQELTGPAETADVWQPVASLPRALNDALNRELGAPATWWRPVTDDGRVIAGLVMTGHRPADLDDEVASAVIHGFRTRLTAMEARARGERLNEELADLNRRLVASQTETARMRSLAMVGQMAAGAAHELNNPLTVISGRAQLLRPQLEDAGRDTRDVETIAAQARRASDMVNELMEVAKPAAPRPTEWSLAELLGELRRDCLEGNLLAAEEFHLSLSDDLPKTRADAAQVRRLFDEVIANAVEAMTGCSPRRLRVNCRAELADDRIVVSIEDNGRGMTPEVLEQAITPFFSHRPAGRGRGLGLTRAARYAEMNGGRLRLTSHPEAGTRVFVELPAVRA